MKRGLGLAVGGWLLVLGAQPALAHTLRLFALAEGTTLKGYVYFGGGARVAGARIAIFGPGGARLGEAVSDAEGAFAFEAAARIDHRLVADAGAGHVAEFTVKAEELPEALNGQAGGTAADRPVMLAEQPVGAWGPTAAGISGEALQVLVDQAIARQIRPLREQLDAYEAKVRWHDVLGGIGYIFGIAGVAFYVLARR